MEKVKQLIFNEKNNTIFISVFVIGLFTHGSRFFTVYLSHDDLTMIDPGTTYTSGRWFLQLLFNVEKKIFGSHVNAKGFIAIMTFFFISIICIIIAKYLNITKKVNLILLCGLMVTFPYVTSLFGYTFTADYYYISIIMSMFAAVLIKHKMELKNDWWRMVLSVVLLGLSMAVYQTSICMFISFLTLLAIKESLSNSYENWKNYIIRCVHYILICILGCGFYFISNKLVLLIKGLEMSNYQGLDNMEYFTIGQMAKRAIFAYKEFFFPSNGESYSLFYVESIRLCYRCVIVGLSVFCIYTIIKHCKQKNWKKVVQLSILYLLYPLAVNSVFLTADVSTTHIYSLMMYQGVFVFISILYVKESVQLKWENYTQRKEKKVRCNQACIMVICLMLLFTCIYYCYTANICYTKAAIQQQQTISYFNKLITRIESTKGYRDEYKIAYINAQEKDEKSLGLWEVKDLYRIAPYDSLAYINQYNWIKYMHLWCGYEFEQVSAQKLSELMCMDGVKIMPCYPDDGSIQIIGDIIVVKFSNTGF